MAKKRSKFELFMAFLTVVAAIGIIIRRKLQPIESAPILPPAPPKPATEPARIVLPPDLVNAEEGVTEEPVSAEVESTLNESEQPIDDAPAEAVEYLDTRLSDIPPPEPYNPDNADSLDLAEAAEANDAPEMMDEEDDPIGYCVSCRTKRHMRDAHEETTENGRRALRGTCEVCGTKMFRFLPNK